MGEVALVVSDGGLGVFSLVGDFTEASIDPAIVGPGLQQLQVIGLGSIEVAEAQIGDGTLKEGQGRVGQRQNARERRDGVRVAAQLEQDDAFVDQGGSIVRVDSQLPVRRAESLEPRLSLEELHFLFGRRRKRLKLGIGTDLGQQ